MKADDRLLRRPVYQFFALAVMVSFLMPFTVVAQDQAAQIENAIEMMQGTGQVEPRSMAAMYASAAQLHFQNGDSDRAMSRVNDSLKLCRQHQISGVPEMALRIAANILNKADDEVAAAFLKEQISDPAASAEFKKSAMKILGQQLVSTGNVVTAIGILKSRLELIQKQSPGSLEEAQTLLEYGQACLSAKIYDLGAEALTQSNQLAQKLKNGELEAQTSFALGAAMLSSGELEPAVKVLTTAIDRSELNQETLLRPSLLLTLANVQMRQANYNDARATINRLKKDFPEDTQSAFGDSMLATISLAEAMKQKRSEAAIKNLIDVTKQAIAAKRKSLNVGSNDDMRRLTTLPDYLALASYQLMVNDFAGSQKSLKEVDAAIETTRRQYDAAIKVGAMNEDEANVLLADQAVFADELRQQILIKSKKYNEALVIAERSRGKTQAELMRKSLGMDGSDTRTPVLSIDEMKAIAADQETTLLVYSLVHRFDPATRGYFPASHFAANPHSVYAWVITPSGSVVFRETVIGQSMTALVGAARQQITRPADPRDKTKDKKSDQSTSAMRRLHELLIEPVEELLPKDPESRVTIVPQGSLFLIPFAALVDADNRPVILKHTLTTVPSVEALQLAKQQFEAVKLAKKTEVLIVGNPSMPSIATRPDKPAHQLTPLAGAEAEAIFLGKLMKTDPLVGAAATEVAVVKRMKEARYIHLATHGLLESENLFAQSYLSAIALAPTENEDGFLTVRETMRLKLKAELAVLSACDTGRGRISGDGVIGLSRGYIAAGVPTIVVSLWPVSDAATKDLMSMYYLEMLKGTDKAAALRLAMLKTRERYTAPVAWAPFVIHGYAR